MVVHNHVWDEKVGKPSAKTEGIDNPNVKREEEDHANVTDHDLPEMLLLIEVGVGVEMAVCFIIVLSRACSIQE